MKLASSVPAISIFLLLTTAKNTTVPKETPTAAINLASFHSTIGARDLSSDVSLDPSEPSERSNPSDPSLDVRPPKEAQEGKRTRNLLKKLRVVRTPKTASLPRNASRVIVTGKPSRSTAVGENVRQIGKIVSEIITVVIIGVGADGAPGDEWGDIGPDSGDMEELVDSGDTTTTPASLERRELVVEAREFDLEIGENPDEDGLDSELIEKGKTAYWGNY
ncbi:hypothetical protein N7448_000782 [Penicillium atrosanguineum]|nr:hypothetical protein N7448_000782 [Penicillium atrosanguineum]